MNIADLNVPLLYVGSIILVAVKMYSSFARLEQYVNLKVGELEQSNKLQDEARKAKDEKYDYLFHAFDEKIEHRTRRLSGSITQMQSYLEKQGDFVRRDPLYDGGNN